MSSSPWMWRFALFLSLLAIRVLPGSLIND
ncbi:MAG: hypothetical protein FAZ92_00817 [Accumulibacter sp.]|nr:MAG: hypothetical protein FAZ92_00817 [Accumulibacter sp.]